MVGGLNNSDVLSFCEWNIARVDQSLGERSQEREEGDLEQDPYLQPPRPVEGVWKMLATPVMKDLKMRIHTFRVICRLGPQWIPMRIELGRRLFNF